MSELEKLLYLLNDDPNAMGLITHSDFKELNKVLQKRKSKIIIKGQDKEQVLQCLIKIRKLLI